MFRVFLYNILGYGDLKMELLVVLWEWMYLFVGRGCLMMLIFNLKEGIFIGVGGNIWK